MQASKVHNYRLVLLSFPFENWLLISKPKDLSLKNKTSFSMEKGV